MYDDDEEYDCPLCMEELDLSDRNFRPCPCGYQICRFCWHHIKENLNGRCPACRRLYSEQTVEFTPITSDELARLKKEKKEKEKQQKEMESVNRRHLTNMRVVQKNLVYVIGLNPKIATEEILSQPDYFGQYGKIQKIVVNKRTSPSSIPGQPAPQPSIGVYITYARKEDAEKAIEAVDGSMSEGRILRASYGTTKYCTYYLRNMVCQNPGCMYLHEPGEDADSFTKEDLAIGKHHLRDHVASSEHAHKVQVLGRHSDHTHSSNPSTPTIEHNTPHITSSIPINAHHFPSIQSEGRKADANGKLLYQSPQTDSAKVVSHWDDEDKSALPRTASWARSSPSNSNPSTPSIHNSILPDRASTPDNFGPPLSLAVAASQKLKAKQKIKEEGGGKQKEQNEKDRETTDAGITEGDRDGASGRVAGRRKPIRITSDMLVQYVLGSDLKQSTISPKRDRANDGAYTFTSSQSKDLSTWFEYASTNGPSTDPLLSLNKKPKAALGPPTPYTGSFNPFADDPFQGLPSMSNRSSMKFTNGSEPPSDSTKSRVQSRFDFAQGGDDAIDSAPMRFSAQSVPPIHPQLRNQGYSQNLDDRFALGSNGQANGSVGIYEASNAQRGGMGTAGVRTDAEFLQRRFQGQFGQRSLMMDNLTQSNGPQMGMSMPADQNTPMRSLDSSFNSLRFDRDSDPSSGLKSPPPGINIAGRLVNSQQWPVRNSQQSTALLSALSGHRPNASPANGMTSPQANNMDYSIAGNDDFFGEFLKKAAQATAAANQARAAVGAAINKAETTSNIPFQDPAIMSVGGNSPNARRRELPSGQGQDLSQLLLNYQQSCGGQQGRRLYDGNDMSSEGSDYIGEGRRGMTGFGQPTAQAQAGVRNRGY